MPETKHLPNINRISVLSSAVLLAYTITGFISIPGKNMVIQLPGLLINIQLNERIIVGFLLAGLTATGADWIVRDHPAFYGRYSIQHWLLPTLTAWSIGLILFQQPFSTFWWLIFGIGGTTLVMVLIAEYIVVDPDDIRRIPATIGLIALAYGLFLTLAITIRAIEVRVFLLVPTIVIASGLACLRTIQLLHKQWAIIHTIIVAVVIGEMSAALNYLRLDPVTFGLVLLGPAYALTSFAGDLLDKQNRPQSVLEPMIVLIIVWGLAFLIR